MFYLSNSFFETLASTALKGSSNKYICASLYKALATLSLALWPPLKFMPFSPICVFSPFGNSFRSFNYLKELANNK